MPKVVIAGALGVVGRAMVERFSGRPGLEVVALSRRTADFAPDATWVSVDLADATAAAAALAPHRDATHVVYAALSEQPALVRGWRDPTNAGLNVAMLRNLLDALDPAPLVHLTLMQGTKAYGVHTGRPMRVPARESDAVRDHANWYFDQEDLVRERSQRGGFAWTILRPQIVLGVAVGSAMNPVATLAVYAALARELGRPLRFPGDPCLLTECTDARLIAAAAEWAWNAPGAHGEAFNVANGDVIVWETFFGRLAHEFGLALGAPTDERMADAMPRHADTWKALARREQLAIDDLDRLIGLSWQYADATWASRRPLRLPPLVSTIKLRQAGFGAAIDTEECIIDLIARMRAHRYLPALPGR